MNDSTAGNAMTEIALALAMAFFSIMVLTMGSMGTSMQACPSSKHLGLLSLFINGGSGSSWFDVKPLCSDGSSGGFGLSSS